MRQTIKCLIVDDEPLALNIIKEYIHQVPQLQLVGTSTSAMQAFQILNQQSIDLLFLDIEMPEMNGINFIKSLAHPPAVILTTAYREYAIESYEIEVIDYLLKPISFSRFFKSINRYLKSSGEKQSQSTFGESQASSGSIYVYSNKKNIKVFFNDILYIESIKDYVRIHTPNNKIISKDTISRYEKLLPNSFLRVHRSFIINSKKISAFTHHDIEIGQKEIPIGSSYKREVLERLKS